MVKYYVKITDEEPSSDEKALWFELSNEEGGETEFFVLDRSEFSKLVEKFENVQRSYESASANFNDTVVTNIVAPAVTSYMSSLEGVENATNLVDSEDNSKYYDYSALNDALEDLETTKLDISSVDSSLNASSTNPLQNKAIMSALDGKANTSDIDSLQSTVNGKANASHTHTGWNGLTINSYCWLRYNPQLRLVEFRYVRSKYNFSSTSNIKLHSGLIPSAYRPMIGDVVLAVASSKYYAYIENETGDMYVRRDETGSNVVISCSGFWTY